jgi:hypothetical protein
MTRRGWMLVFGTGMCVALGPGCSHMSVPAAQAPSIASVPPVPEKPPVELVGPGAVSPYHPVASVPAATPTPLADRQVERAHYPASTAGPELVPAPTPPARTASPPAPTDAAPLIPKPEEVKPKPVEDPPLVAALRHFLNHENADAIDCLRSYPKPARELLSSLLPLIVRLTEPSEWKDPREVAVLMEQLGQVRDSLRPLAPLSIDKMRLVSSIQSFGVYQPLPDDQPLYAGDFVQVYTELQNFSTRQDGNLHAIRLRSRVEICDFDGKTCWRYDFRDANKPDLSTSLRHDFFNNYTFYLPSIPPGRYTLRLQVTDMPTQRTVTRTLDFRVAPARSQRGRRDEG